MSKEFELNSTLYTTDDFGDKTFILHFCFIVVKNGTRDKNEGQVCGRCEDPKNNNFCGHCSVGLKCIKDASNQLLQDICKKGGTY